MHLLPGGPFDVDELGSEIIRNQLIAKYKLDLPIADQFYQYLSNIFHLDFGKSFVYTNETVTHSFMLAMQNTIQIFLLGLGMILLIFFLLNYLLFLWPQLKKAIVGLYNILVAIPVMVFILIGFYFFCVFLGWTPVVFDGDTKHLIFPVFLLTFKPSIQLVVFFSKAPARRESKKIC